MGLAGLKPRLGVPEAGWRSVAGDPQEEKGEATREEGVGRTHLLCGQGEQLSPPTSVPRLGEGREVAGAPPQREL